MEKESKMEKEVAEKKNKAKKARKEVPNNSQVVSEKRGLKSALVVFLMCVWVFASVIAAQFVVGAIMVAILGSDKVAEPVWTAVYSALSYIVAGCLVILVPANLMVKWRIDSKKSPAKKGQVAGERTTWKDLGIKGWLTWTDIGLAVAGVVFALILAQILTSIFSNFPWFDANETQEIIFSPYLIGFNRVIAYVTLAVVAPVAEEIIFRGWLYGKMRERLSWLPEWAGILISILVTSVLFGLVHMQWSVGVVVFALSVVMCALREITGTIYAGILMHIIWNSVAFYLLYVI